jgi:hypothetical protein
MAYTTIFGFWLKKKYKEFRYNMANSEDEKVIHLFISDQSIERDLVSFLYPG